MLTRTEGKETESTVQVRGGSDVSGTVQLCLCCGAKTLRSSQSVWERGFSRLTKGSQSRTEAALGASSTVFVPRSSFNYFYVRQVLWLTSYSFFVYLSLTGAGSGMFWKFLYSHWFRSFSLFFFFFPVLLMQIEKIQQNTKYWLIEDGIDEVLFFHPRWSVNLGSTSSVTFSSPTPPALARSSSSTWGKSARGCGCRQGNISSSPPPLSPTRRPTLSSGFSLRNRPNLSEWLNHRERHSWDWLNTDWKLRVLSIPSVPSTYYKHFKGASV